MKSKFSIPTSVRNYGFAVASFSQSVSSVTEANLRAKVMVTVTMGMGGRGCGRGQGHGDGDGNGEDLHCPSPQLGSSWSCKRRLPEASEIARADILERGAEPL